MILKHLFFFFVLLLVVMAGCKLKAAPDASQADAKSYDAHGVVRQIATDLHSVTIQHEAIAGYMPAMTMDFPVKDTNELAGISPSDEITFKLIVHENGDWVDDIHFIAHRIENVTNNNYVFHVPTAELEPGDLLPDYEFTTEKGGKIRFSDFRGQAVAFTFFFTSCPLPDYCPRMNRDFSEARKLILATANAPANWQLLSISFDPGFDTPEMLTGYANFYRGEDTNRWLFAVASTNTLAEIAPRLDLMVMRNSMGVTHNLRTVVLDPQGRIFRQFDGNQWTPQELADAIVRAAQFLPAR
jgi:protein SCO1/2